LWSLILSLTTTHTQNKLLKKEIGCTLLVSALNPFVNMGSTEKSQLNASESTQSHYNFEKS
jgi:hypothetical protein